MTTTPKPTGSEALASDEFWSPPPWWQRIEFWLAASFLAVCGLIGWLCLVDLRSNDQLHDEIRRAFAGREHSKAARLGRVLLARRGQEHAGRFMTAKALSHQTAVREAVALYEQIPDDHPTYGIAARIAAGELLLFRSRRLSAAAECFHRALALDPYHTQAHERLSYIYGIAGLTWRAVPHRMALLCRNEFGSVHLLMLALGPNHEEDARAIRGYHAASPDDPLALCAMARLSLRTNERDEAARLLRRAVETEPHWPEPQAWLGTLLLESGNGQEFRDWQQSLPADAGDNAELWFLRGRHAQEEQDVRCAVRCFAEAVRCEPNHQAANFRLAQLLQELGETERARPFLQRARLLEDLVNATKSWQISSDSTESIQRSVRICAELGLMWEAWGWRRQLDASKAPEGLPATPRPDPPISGRATLDDVLAAYRDARQTEESAKFARADFSAFPLPEVASINLRGATDDVEVESNVRFEDSTREAGIEFRYFNGHHTQAAGEFMYESTGGGVGVLDYDLDGWPDLFFTQGCDWPPMKPSPYRDALCRNLLGERFQDVTDAARIVEHDFGQGLTVGDIDNDGFPDLYVCNIGSNRLYRNNGDGTFTEITEAAGVGGNEWSTSCVLADFSGDGLPDIYVVTYVEGEGMFERSCRLADGSPRLCTPHEFQATEDRLYLNLGDGKFRDVSADANVLAPNGKGLGVVAADFDHSGRLSLFVANDTVPNFFFHNLTSRTDETPRFQEKGFVTGLAVDGVGQSQACMGVACGDATDDGLLDLFVTNFYQESNTLYVQQPGLMFSDLTRSAGLYEPSLPQLGFGTQFLDADLDGRLDLVVTNGHVGDLSHVGTPYQMPTQVFSNQGAGKFRELPAAGLGEFFEAKHLGRGLARLDWNRDGRDDFAVSHLEESAALLTNRTETDYHFLTVQLRGVSSPRDAIGTTVRVTCGDQTWTRQLTAGDGYHAGNERQIHFGLGQASRIDHMEIRWPTGTTQSFADLDVDSFLLVIEDLPTPFEFANRR